LQDLDAAALDSYEMIASDDVDLDQGQAGGAENEMKQARNRQQFGVHGAKTLTEAADASRAALGMIWGSIQIGYLMLSVTAKCLGAMVNCVRATVAYAASDLNIAGKRQEAAIMHTNLASDDLGSVPGALCYTAKEVAHLACATVLAGYEGVQAVGHGACYVAGRVASGLAGPAEEPSSSVDGIEFDGVDEGPDEFQSITSTI
jgi:hypothetical protein